MKNLVGVFLIMVSAVGMAADVVDVIPYTGLKHFPYTPTMSCQAGKTGANITLVEAEQFWGAWCAKTKAGELRLPKPAAVALQGLLDKILTIPEQETLSPDAQYLIGRLWLLNRSPAEAIGYFQRAVEADSAQRIFATALSVAFNRHFSTLVEGQRQEMAFQLANLLAGRLSSLPTPNADDFLLPSRLYYMADSVPSAAALLQVAHDQLPQSDAISIAFSLCLSRIQQAQDAVKILEGIKSVGSESTRLYLLGVAAWQLGKLDVAREALLQAATLNPKNADAKRLLKQISQ